MVSYEGISKKKIDGVRAFVRRNVGKPIKVQVEGGDTFYGACQFMDDFGNVTMNCSGTEIQIQRLALRVLQSQKEKDNDV